MKTNIIYNEDCISSMVKYIEDASIDCILTDPPYKYLKNQKLEVDFDEVVFFNEAKRVLKPNGFIVLFGRGTSFYRWNTRLADLGFTFKEEIVWDKSYCSSPLMAISRVHETISIYTKGKGVINRVKVPYLEMKAHDINSVIQDIKRMRNILKNPKSLQAVQDFLENNKVSLNGDNATTISFIRSDWQLRTTKKCGVTITDHTRTGDRSVNIINSITQGMNEKTIIKQPRENYTGIHPTQKPVRLIERLLALTTKEEMTVLDPFSGSGTTAQASLNTNRKYIAFEIDKEYYDLSIERLQKKINKTKQHG